MKNVKRYVSLIIIAVMLITTISLTIPVHAYEYFNGKCGDNLTWKYNTGDGKLIISGTGDMYNYEAGKSPWNLELKYYDFLTIIIESGVTSIGDNAFRGMVFSGDQVILPEDSLTYIGKNAFSGTAISSINLPSTLKTIEEQAFYQTALTSVTIPASVNYIGHLAFVGTSRMYYGTTLNNIQVDEDNQYYTSVDGILFNKDKTELICYPNSKKDDIYTVPETVKKIHDCAFTFSGAEPEEISRLNEVHLPYGLEEIGSRVFLGRTLKNFTIPETVHTIGDRAFEGALTSINIPDSVTSIGEECFRNCKATEIAIGSGITTIPKGAFSGTGTSKKLTKLTIGDNVKYIAKNAFSYSCYKEIIFSDSVESIGEDAFLCVSKLEKIEVPSTNEYFSSIDGVLYNKDKTVLLLCPDQKELKTIEPSVTTIGCKAFAYNDKVKNLVLSNNVTKIEDSAFYECAELDSITIYDSTLEISYNAFYGNEWVTIICSKGSYAQEYALSMNMHVEYVCFHSFTNYVTNDDETCTENATKTAYCDKGCGTTDTIIIEGSALAHSFTDYVDDDNATCTENGTKTAKCERCDVTDTIVIENSALGHSFTNYEVITEATCTQNGVKEALCDNGCSEKDVITEEALGHTPGEWVIIEEATYYNEGYKIQSCTVCSETLNTEVIPVLEYKGFPDVWENSWYAEGVEYCFKQGYIIGTNKGTFEPSSILTREQFVVILARISGAKLSEYTESAFEDVNADSWYGSSVIWANENGYVNGIGNSRFGVGQPLSREQLATMFYRYAEKQGFDVEEKSDLNYCKDKDKISSWAFDACAWAIKANLLSSTSQTDNYLSPKMSVTRSQAAKIFKSFDEYKK